MQAQIFSQLSSAEQEKIRKGYGVVITDIENEKQICLFNMENYRPPDSAIESFARFLLPKIREYYSKEENIREFEEYMSKQEGDVMKNGNEE